MLDGVDVFSSLKGKFVEWLELRQELIDCFDGLVLINISGDEKDFWICVSRIN